MLKLIRNRTGLVLAGLIAALCPMLMAPTGGFPSRPLFQAVGVGAAVPATGIINAATDLQINGTSITGGVGASNIPLLNGANTFTNTNTFNGAVAINGNLTGQTAVALSNANSSVITHSVKNTNAGVSAAVQLVSLNDLGNGAHIGVTSSGFSGPFLGGGLTGTQGFIYSDYGVCLGTGGGTARLCIDTSGNWTTPNAASGSGFAKGTFTITGNGFTANPTATATYSVAGGVATVFIPTLSATSNATTFNLTGIPAAIQPATLSPIVVALVCSDNGTIFGSSAAPCTVKINAASGTWNVLDAGSNLWTASGTKAVFNNMGGGMTLTYPLN